MSFRTMLTTVVVLVALVPASAHAATNRAVLGVATGTATINTATFQITNDMELLASHIGRGTARFEGLGTRADGIVRAVGPFSIVTSRGDKLTGTATLVGAGPSLVVHPVGFIMTITGGTGRFARASGVLTTSALVTPRLPFTPPLLHERVDGALQGYLTY